MRKTIRVSLFVVSAFLLLGILIKGWWIFQDKYIYEPKVRSAVSNFIDAVKASEYETLSDNSMFTDKTQFNQIKAKISLANVYSVEIKDWAGDGVAYVFIKLSDNTVYALVVIPTQEHIFSCRGIEYRILTIR